MAAISGETLPSSRLRIGDWSLDATTGVLSRGAETIRLEDRTLRLLLALARRPGEIVSVEALLAQAWPEVIVTPDSVYQAVASLRRVLGDDAKQPRYIVTVPRLGYRMVAAVGPDKSAPSGAARRLRTPARAGVWLGLAAAATLAGSLFAIGQQALVPKAIDRVGVAPFVDLTPSMDQDALADETTEGVADRLSANPALRSPGFRSTYYLIGKPTTAAQAARALGVDYLVDGGVRRAGETVRISARLVRAQDGRVLWSQTYNAPIAALGSAQTAIASAVAKRLALEGRAPSPRR